MDSLLKPWTPQPKHARRLSSYGGIATRKTRVELANAIFEYIEIFHNRRRRHSSLGMRTPIEFELLNNQRAAA